MPMTDERPPFESSQPEHVQQSVRAFYEEVGWTTDGGGVTEDAHRFEDLRPTSGEYLRRCHHRVTLALPPDGRLLLDVASGPLQRDDFLEYSAGYRYRVCVDLTLAALRGARRRIGTHGLFVVGDITRLPFRDDAFDGVVSLHTIYHVPAPRQAQAFLELHRVLARGRRAVVVYAWGRHAPLMFLFDALPHKLASLWASLRTRAGGRRVSPAPLYFAPQSPGWFRREVASRVPTEVRVWRSLSPYFQRHWVSGNALGSAFLRVVFALEERFPHAFGRWGNYPMIVLRKADRGRSNA